MLAARATRMTGTTGTTVLVPEAAAPVPEVAEQDAAAAGSAAAGQAAAEAPVGEWASAAVAERAVVPGVPGARVPEVPGASEGSRLVPQSSVSRRSAALTVRPAMRWRRAARRSSAQNARPLKVQKVQKVQIQMSAAAPGAAMAAEVVPVEAVLVAAASVEAGRAEWRVGRSAGLAYRPEALAAARWVDRSAAAE